MLRLRGRDENGNTVLFSSHDIQDNVVVFINGEFLLIDPDTIEAVEDDAMEPVSCDSKILVALESAHKFIEAIMSFYGTNLEVANWHMNGDLEHWDSFFDENMSGDELELLNAAIAMIKEGGAPRKALLGEVRAAILEVKESTLYKPEGSLQSLTVESFCFHLGFRLNQLEAKL